MNKLNSNDIAEIGRYFNPNAQIVTTLPDPKSVRDFSEVWILNSKNTYDNYKMVSGQWQKTGSNVNNITNIINGGGGGSGTAGVTSVTATNPITSSGGENPNISHNTSGVVAGSYTKTNIIVDTFGHITSIVNGDDIYDANDISSTNNTIIIFDAL